MYQRIMLSIVCALLLWTGSRGPVYGQEPDRTESGKIDLSKEKQRRVRRLLQHLTSDRREQRLRARQNILRMGPEALPAIRRRLRNSEMGEHYELLRQLRALKGKKNRSNSSRVRTFNVQNERKNVQSGPDDKQDPRPVDEFLKRRYREALKAYQSGEFQRADRLAGAILTVAPKVSFRGRLKRFRVEVRERLVNSTMISASISVDKYRYEWGELVHVNLTLKNIAERPMTIYFDPSRISSSVYSTDRTPRPSNESETRTDSGDDGKTKARRIYMEVKRERIGMFGSSTKQNRHRNVDVPGRIRLAPRETWSKRVIIRTTSFSQKHVLRLFEVKAKVRPSLLVLGDQKLSRWIEFEEARFELYPKGMREALPATPDKIRYHLQSGNMRDVFFLTHLLPRKHYESVVKFFLTSLPDLNQRSSRTIMVLLRALTDQKKMFRKADWLEWGRSTFDLDMDAPEETDSPTYERFFKHSIQGEDDG